MLNARRVYAYLVSLISYAAVLLAAIALVRELLAQTPYAGDISIAFPISVLLIATPIYMGHWHWQQRKCAEDEEERGALERRVYLYVVLGGSVALVAINALDLLQWLLGVDVVEFRVQGLPAWRVVLYYVLPIAMAAGVWLYHTRLLALDRAGFPDTGARGSAHRLYLYLFAGAGLTMVLVALFELLRWLLSFLGAALFDAVTLDVDVIAALPWAVVGLAIWLLYWVSAQRLFRTNEAEETSSTLRKFYLYMAIFIGVGGSVSAAALVLSGILRALLGLSPGGDMRDPAALIIAFGLLWFYHRKVLGEDARAAEHTEQQEEIRRIYLYLLSAVGLVALLVGAIGDISTLLFIVDDGISDAHREALSYFTAALIAGAPVWFLAWRKVQQEASYSDRRGRYARESLVRKIYLYFFLFVSIMSVLGGAIYVLYRLLQWLLAGESVTLVDVAIPLTIVVVQLLVWVYHLGALRTDRQLSRQDEIRRLSDVRLALVDHGGSLSLRAFSDRLHKALPETTFHLLHKELGNGMAADNRSETLAQVQQAEVIVVPSSLFWESDAEDRELADAVARSPAQKIILPDPSPGWHWVGLESQPTGEIADEALRLLRTAVAGDEIGGRRRPGCGAVALTIAGVFVLVVILARLISAIFYVF